MAEFTTTTIRFTRKSFFEAAMPTLLPLMNPTGNGLSIQPPPASPEVVIPEEADQLTAQSANETPAPAAPAVCLRNVTVRDKPSAAVRPGTADQQVPDAATPSARQQPGPSRSSSFRARKRSVGTQRASETEPLGHRVWKY